jgi:[NiFe] hydrogenase assembly HybE family chaperone
LSSTDRSTDDLVTAAGARLAAAFERIHRERMAGLPILHPKLRVAAVGGRAWRGHWLGVLVTPWCMNLVLTPLHDTSDTTTPWERRPRRDSADLAPAPRGTSHTASPRQHHPHPDALDLTQDPHGTKRVLDFPAGHFEFLSSPLDDLGTIATCSLFSPMQAFADQAAAEATAAAVLTTLFESAPAPAPAADPAPGGDTDTSQANAGAAPASMPEPPSGPGVSRRDLLRGNFRSA